MKTKIYTLLGSIVIGGLSLIPTSLKAQNGDIQFYRPNSKDGVNIFETSKKDTVPFKGLKVKVGGGFEIDYQMLRDQNTAIPVTKTVGTATGNVNNLISLIDGVDLPMANLSFDVQLADGIRLNLTSYLAARHHEETWVKGGYLQIDKLPFLHSQLADNIMKSVTVVVGQYDVDYGDQHFRRSDGGNTIYNPFVENYVMDEFATEMGIHVYYKCAKTGLFAMGGITNGELDETVLQSTKTDAETGLLNDYQPAFLGKLGFDKQLTPDFRLRISGSFYTEKSANSITMFGGDRTGSHYFGVMSNPTTAAGSVLSNANDYNAFSGRFNPGFSEELHTYMGNVFLKYKGLEFFGTAENAVGRSISETSLRGAAQYAADLIYRFPAKTENFYVGYRYDTVTATILGNSQSVTVDRSVGALGWFITKNIMMKGEYVTQSYNNYDPTNILNGGKFNGFMVEAAIGF
ncbi:hypothetical protein [uncultured Mucilaginibacter sp.]|uniref:hypothetical protein n=1 Tax=uncultured Mucilaginibacter sp. TaxID=797541 RepID=UPI0025FDA9C0|nr:hypothetical protein [uncultured Mucilaginibacter sp.]